MLFDLENRQLIGLDVELLVAADSGRKSADTGRLTGRARDGRLVHFRAGDAAAAVRPGDVVVTTVTDAAPHHLIADGWSVPIMLRDLLEIYRDDDAHIPRYNPQGGMAGLESAGRDDQALAARPRHAGGSDEPAGRPGALPVG